MCDHKWKLSYISLSQGKTFSFYSELGHFQSHVVAKNEDFSEKSTFLGITCDLKCSNSLKNENLFSWDDVMWDNFIVWSHIFVYFNFYFIHLVVKHPVYGRFNYI